MLDYKKIDWNNLIAWAETVEKHGPDGFPLFVIRASDVSYALWDDARKTHKLAEEGLEMKKHGALYYVEINTLREWLLKQPIVLPAPKNLDVRQLEFLCSKLQLVMKKRREGHYDTPKHD